MSNVNSLQVFAALPESPAHSLDFVLHVDSVWFVRAVIAAAFQLERFVSYASPDYVTPDPYVVNADALKEIAQSLEHQYQGVEFDREDLGLRVYAMAWDGLSLLQEYVKVVNAYPDRCHVGERYWVREVVYRTLVTAHNWSVRQIKATHKQSGKHFGSATRQQMKYMCEGVRDWPARYKFRDMSISLLPKDEPGYYSDDFDEEATSGTRGPQSQVLGPQE